MMFRDTTEDLEENLPQGKEEELPLKTETDTQTKEITTIEKFKYFKNNISVELVAAFYIMASAILMISMQNLCLEKACLVNLKFSNDVCTDLKLRRTANHSLEEDEVQKLMASVQGMKNSLPSILPIIAILFLGAWSDKTGRRKICLLLPIIGDLVTCVINVLSIYFFYEMPVRITAFLQIFFLALSGGWYTMILGTFSYLSDITSKETRTFRLGILNLCISTGFPVGMGLSGILTHWLGYYGVISISSTVFIINFCYVCFVIEDHTWLEDKEKSKRKGCTGCLLSFCDMRTLKETVEILTKKGPNNRRFKMCIIMIVTCLFYGPSWGEMSILYIFTRYRFNWDEVQYSFFYTYYLFIHSVGTLFSITVFSKILKMDDACLGMISAASKIIGSLVLAFARYDYEAYLSPLVEILNGTADIALKSLASKLVTQQELGKLFSVIGIVESLASTAFAPIYSWVYTKTLHTLPGAFMVLSTLVTVPMFLIFAWFYYDNKKQQIQQQVQLEQQEKIMSN